MRCIMLSGGSGKRLWPLSNDVRSKQFLKFLRDENGDKCSMLQRVLGQLNDAGLDAEVTIAASNTQIDEIQNQVDDSIDLVLEPERRDTFPAIALACAHLYFNKNVDLEEAVVVLPVDPYAELSFFRLFKDLTNLAQSGEVDLALLGVKPVFPTEKYGYIVPDTAHKGWQRVKRFKEKPTEEEAQRLIEQGALWNCGVFSFKLRYIIDHVREQIEANSYEDVLNQYTKLSKRSFDYEVVENADSIGVIGYEGEWKDIGTWNTLAEELSENTSGHVLEDSNNENTHVINELGIPIIVMGAKDMIISASYSGILIADKHQSSYMKPLVDKLEQRPMVEKRQWGEYKVLDISENKEGRNTMVRKVLVKAGCAKDSQRHRYRKEVWTIIKGEGEFILDGSRSTIRQGDVLQIGQGACHALRATTEIELLETQIGIELDDNDSELVEIDW